MARVIKEHYVPQFYLRNFSTDGKTINVFDKLKDAIRKNQSIRDVAQERGFYDTKLANLMQDITTDKQAYVLEGLNSYLKETSCLQLLEEIDQSQYIEKTFLCEVEGLMSYTIESIISRAKKSNLWVRKNCYAIREDEKLTLSFCIAIQVLRTRAFRENTSDTMKKVSLDIIKQDLSIKTKLANAFLEIDINHDYVKLLQLLMLLNPEISKTFTDIFFSHIWILAVNSTNIPFSTSDNPVVTFPHKHDGLLSYSGYASEAVEIAYPISSTLLINMFDRKAFFNSIYKDRKYIMLENESEVVRFNMMQLCSSIRCVYSESDVFQFEKTYLEKIENK